MSLMFITPMLAPGMPGISKLGMPPAGVGHLDLDLLVVQFAVAQLLAETESRVAGLAVLPTSASSTRSSALRCARPSRPRASWSRSTNADLDQVAHDLLDIAADIADLGELGGLDLDERRAGQLGQTAGDLGLADAGGPDHQDVLRHHLFAHLAFQLLAPPAVAQRDGHGALGVLLADDVAVEFGNDLAGGKMAWSCTISRSDTPSKARYEARVEGIEEPGELTISKVSDVLIIADHTYAPESMRGMGVASELVNRLIADARAAGQRIIPLCPYVKAQAAKHRDDWADVIQW
jgi:predicted GNAT family acetyltransferase